MSIPDVNLGDLVRIYTVDLDFVNLISVTSDNMATQPANYLIWDGHNYDGAETTSVSTFSRSMMVRALPAS